MFKLAITFSSLAELSSFVKKMGNDVIGADVEHTQPLTPDSVPTEAPKAKTRSRSVKVDAKVEAPVVDLAPNMGAVPTGGMPFPGGAPTSFAPSSAAAPAPTAPVHQPAPVAQPAPVNATVAAPQVDPNRLAWNSACGELIGALEKTGLDQGQCDQIIQGAFASAGAAPQKIMNLTDAQIQPFYYALKTAVEQVQTGTNAAMGQYR